MALFVVCALAPLSLAAALLYHEFDQSLHLTQQQDVNKDLRVLGMTLLSRLISADDGLRAVIQSGADDYAKLIAGAKRLSWAADARVLPLDGFASASTAAAPVLKDWQLKSLQLDRAALAWGGRGAGFRQLYLVRALASGDALVVEVSQSQLWGDTDSYFADSVVSIEAADGGLVYGPAPVANDGAQVLGRWELFLPSHFSAAAWHLTLSRPAVATLTTLRGVKVVFPAIVLLTILIVSLLAISLIRRQMRPLQELVAGTRRIAQRDFDTPIRIEGSDEFQGLAESFNEMTRGLRQQFAALETLAKVDHLLLKSPAIEEVLDTLLPKISAILGSAAVSVLLVDQDSQDHVRAYDYCRGGSAARPVRRVAAQVALLEAACMPHELHTNLLLDAHIATLLEPLLQAGARSFALHALGTGSKLSGILLIGFDAATGSVGVAAVRPDEFAMRLSVALDKIEQTSRLQHQAHFDALTGLANRRLFTERLAAELASEVRSTKPGAVLYIDLDHFKRVNDTEGHGAGDQLLCTVAERLKCCVGQMGIAARLGGDEFAVLLPGMIDVDAIRQMAQQMLKTLAEPIPFGTRQRHVSASIGIALYPADAATVENVMMSGDVAMYRAKDLGRGQAVFFKTEMQHRLEAVAAIETGLHRALRDQQLRVLYQPIYSARSGRMRGAEALVRWPSAPGESARPPSQFIPVAEESGLIVELGAWVLRTSCRQYMSWRRQGMSLDYISVNVSVRQMVGPQLVATVKTCLEQCGMNPSELQLEITESVLAEEGVTEATIQALAGMGVRLALDDFGTGFSSLNYLRRYPIHTIKIDQSFVRDLPGSASACRLVEAMLAMARAVERDVVAEGVETREQRDFLKAAGCDSLQGYLLGRPMEAEDLRNFVTLADTAIMKNLHAG